MMRAWLATALLAALHMVPNALARHAAPTAIAYSRLSGEYWQIWTYDLRTSKHRQITDSPFDKRDPVWERSGAIMFRSQNHGLYRVKPGETEVPILRRVWPASDIDGSPDGKQIALSLARTDVRDTSEIWVLSDQGNGRRMLTRGPGLRTDPTWSPDGRWLIYSRSFGAKGSALLRVAQDGSSEEELLHDAFSNVQPRWSPSGRSLVYATNRLGDYDLVVRDLQSGEEHSLSPAPGLDGRPCWSPDGQRIAFSTYRRGRLEIWAVNIDGSNAAPLFAVADEASDPAWR